MPNAKCAEGPGCGEWKRPMKPNPEYKGQWTSPLIDNPEYKVRPCTLLGPASPHHAVPVWKMSALMTCQYSSTHPAQGEASALPAECFMAVRAAHLLPAALSAGTYVCPSTVPRSPHGFWR